MTTFGDEKSSKSIMIKYLLIDACTLCNVLIGCLSFNELSFIISTPHLTMKFLRESGKIVSVKVNQMTTR